MQTDLKQKEYSKEISLFTRKQNNSRQVINSSDNEYERIKSVNIKRQSISPDIIKIPLFTSKGEWNSKENCTNDDIQPIPNNEQLNLSFYSGFEEDLEILEGRVEEKEKEKEKKQVKRQMENFYKNTLKQQKKKNLNLLENYCEIESKNKGGKVFENEAKYINNNTGNESTLRYLEEESNLLSSHFKIIKDERKLLDEEGAYIRKCQNKFPYKTRLNIEDYKNQIDNILNQKIEQYTLLKEQINKLKQNFSL